MATLAKIILCLIGIGAGSGWAIGCWVWLEGSPKGYRWQPVIGIFVGIAVLIGSIIYNIYILHNLIY